MLQRKPVRIVSTLVLSLSLVFLSAIPVGAQTSKDITITKLQTFLQSKGFLVIPKGDTKGNFGPATKKALIKYQKSVGLSASGVFGPQTKAKIVAELSAVSFAGVGTTTQISANADQPVTEASLNARLQAIYRQIALSQRIDQLKNTTITGGSISGTSISGASIAGLSTNTVSEGTNLYYTNGRADARLSATSSLPNITNLSSLASIGSSGTATTFNGSVGIGTTVLDPITGISSNINGTFDVSTYGASGSSQTTTGSVGAGSRSLTLSSAMDFKNGQGILVVGAGPAPLYSTTPTAPTVALGGFATTPGSTTYCYKVAVADYWGGMSAAGTATCISNGPSFSSLTDGNFITVATPGGSNWLNAYEMWLLYRSVSGGPYQLISANSLATSFQDNGFLPDPGSSLYPAAPPSSTVNQYFISSVTSGGGSSVLTLASSATTTVSSAAVLHDDSAAIQAAIDAARNAGGGTVTLGPYTYRLNRQSYWTGSSWAYSKTSVGTANQQGPVLHLYSNINLVGSGKAATTLQSSSVAPNAMIGTTVQVISDGSVPFGLCNGVFPPSDTFYPIANAKEGANVLALSVIANASTFNVGDRITHEGGTNSAEVSCSGAYPYHALNEVVAVDYVAGLLYLRYPLVNAIPYGTGGTAPRAAQINDLSLRDVSVSNLTIDSPGGGVYLGGAIRPTIKNVSMMSAAWVPKLNFNGGRDILIDSVDLRTDASEEFDQSNTIMISNSTLYLYAGSNQVAFSEGTADVTLLNDKIYSNSSRCGLLSRCPGANAIIAGAGSNHLHVNNTQIYQTMTAGQMQAIIAGGVPVSSSLPIPHDITIQNNFIEAPAAVSVALGNAKGVLVSGNSIHQTAGGPVIQVQSGTISKNSVLLDSLSSGGTASAIKFTPPAVPTEMLTIEGNLITITSDPNAGGCIGLVAGSPVTTPPITISNNLCNGGQWIVTDPSNNVPIWFLSGNVGTNIGTAKYNPSYAGRCANASGTCGNYASGLVTVATSTTSVVVSTTAATANSQIHLTQVSSSAVNTALGVTCNTTPVQPTVSAQTDRTNFTIMIGVAPTTTPACFSYTIAN